MVSETTQTAQEPTDVIPGLETGAPEPEEKAQEEAAPAQVEEDAVETQTEPEAEDEPLDLDAFFERVGKSDETLTEFYKKLDEQAATRANKMAETVLEPQLREIRQAHQQAVSERQKTEESMRQISDGVGRVVKAIDKARREDGFLSEEALSNALQSNPTAWSALAQVREDEVNMKIASAREQARTESGPMVADFFIRKGAAHIGKAHLIQEFAEKLSGYKQGTVSDLTIAQDFSQAIFDSGYKTGVKAEREGKTEASRAADRKNAPAHAGDKTSAANAGRPSPQQYAAATREQRLKWKEQGIEPLSE